MAHRIDTVTARDKLKPRREPYWHRLSKGCYLGYRRMSTATDGVWVARAQDERTTGKHYNSLGGFSELPEHQRFDAASKAAQDWFEHLGRGGSHEARTVKDACTTYVKQLRATKGDKAADDAQKRFDSYVLDDPKLAATELPKLTPAILEDWRETLRDRETTSGPRRGQKRTSSTLNRDMTCFRAALNLAYKDGHVTSDFAWRGKLLPLKNADRRRELYLDRDQRRKFIENAAPDLALFLRALAMVPLRPGALASLTVADYDKRLKVLKIGKDKAGADRKLKLPDQTAALFDTATKGKLPTAPLLARADGSAWNKDAWKWPVKQAAMDAELPEGATAYTLRHSTISDLVHDGLDLLTVAQISGTSVRMIEAHYGHLRGNVAASALAKLAL